MRSHEAASRVSLGQSALKPPGVADSPQGKTIRDQIKRERVEFPKPKQIDGQRHSQGR